MQERRQSILQLWHAALSAESAAQLDLKRYITSSLVTLFLELGYVLRHPHGIPAT